jgi:hypothetical protein
MSERGIHLMKVADRQIADLIALFSSTDEAVLHSPCPGREKLGDGTIAACARHTADSYVRIARFVRGEGQEGHGRGYRSQDIDLEGLLTRLSAARSALEILADQTDEQLDAVPLSGEMKFCDGQRTLEQIIAKLLQHQGHNVDALKRAVS